MAAAVGALQRKLASRRFVEMLVESIRENQLKLKSAPQPRTELRKLKEWEGLKDEDRQRQIDSIAKSIRKYQTQLTEFLGQWKQEWALYESQLNVEKAKVRLSAASEEWERVRPLTAGGIMNSSEQRKAESEVSLSEIAVKPAELQLAPYAAIQKEMSELNPDNFGTKALLKDPVVEPVRNTETR